MALVINFDKNCAEIETEEILQRFRMDLVAKSGGNSEALKTTQQHANQLQTHGFYGGRS